MAKIKGVDVIIKVNKGTDELPEWVKVGGQRGATINRGAETIDTSSKDSEGYKESEQGLKEWSINADGVLFDGDEGYNLLLTAYKAGEQVSVFISSPATSPEGGKAIITDFPLEAPYDDVVKYSVTLQGSGKLEEIVAV